MQMYRLAKYLTPPSDEVGHVCMDPCIEPMGIHNRRIHKCIRQATVQDSAGKHSLGMAGQTGSATHCLVQVKALMTSTLALE